MIYWIDGEGVRLSVQGRPCAVAPHRLIDAGDDLSAGCSWAELGFTVADFLPPDRFAALREGVLASVRDAVEQVLDRPCPGFRLDRYHHYCSDEDSHRQVIERLLRRAELTSLPIAHEEIDARVSELCGKRVSCRVAGQIASGYFFVRLVRPASLAVQDNNPPHRDAWLERLRDCLNIYVPLAGSNARSSMPVLPGSHLWCESRVARTEAGSEVNGRKFNVPSVLDGAEVVHMRRPPVGENQVLLFSPYLIHGGAVNLNDDLTRVSLEMRFWRC